MEDIILTVITPVFNSVNFIDKCINNVIDQNCSDKIEHLIIDAGSTDGTLERIIEFSKNHSHIRYISESDNGQSEAMNKGIKLAKGKYISFLNVDDGYFQFVLRRAIYIFNSNVNLEFITGNCKLFNENGDLIYLNRPQRMKSYHQFSYLETFPINPSAYFYNKSIHEKVGYYNEKNHFTMDYEFILKACLKIPIIYFNEDWGYAIYHPGSKSLQDTESNMLFERKRKMFDSIYKDVPLKIKIMAMLYCFYKRLKLLK